MFYREMFFGNILASNLIDKFGKHCLEEESHIYMYQNKIPIVPLAMCDDLLVVSECDFKTELVASYINSQARFNYLRFGLSKCSKMHVCKTKPKFKCTPVRLDQWSSEEIECKKTRKNQLKKKYLGRSEIKDVFEVKYLTDPV